MASYELWTVRTHNFSSVTQVWHALVRAVDAAHTQDILHRDLKPQNFLLVPASSFSADRGLVEATTTIHSDGFSFRLLRDGGPGDVALVLSQDAAAQPKRERRFVIKLTDFGLAQPLAIDASHLSVRGQAGTVKYEFPFSSTKVFLGHQVIVVIMNMMSL